MLEKLNELELLLNQYKETQAYNSFKDLQSMIAAVFIVTNIARIAILANRSLTKVEQDFFFSPYGLYREFDGGEWQMIAHLYGEIYNNFTQKN